jgi:hypothetical protein
VVDLLEQKHGFELINVSTGEACTEFLFRRTGTPAARTIVAELAAAKKTAAALQQTAVPAAHDVRGRVERRPLCCRYSLITSPWPVGR